MSTEAGRRLLERESYNARSFPLIDAEAIAAIEAEARAVLLAELEAGVGKLPATPYYTGDKEAAMCPNCVTPWKCNGPHVLPLEDPHGWEVDRAAVLDLIRKAGEK